MNAPISHASVPGFSHGLPTQPQPTLEGTQGFLKETLPRLSKWQIEEVVKQVRHHYMHKYKANSHKVPKYGSMSKSFDDFKLKRFFKAIRDCEDDKFYLLFKYQSTLGLRIGEAVKLSLANLDFDERQLILKSEKSGRLDTLRIPEQLFSETITYIRAYKEQIEAHAGCLFFPAPTAGYGRHGNYLEANYARNRFRYYCEKAAIDNDVYDITEESGPRQPHKLHLLSTHSLRHYAITKMAKTTNGNIILTSRFARHSQISTTMVYVADDRKALGEAIEAASLADVQAMKSRVLG